MTQNENQEPNKPNIVDFNLAKRKLTTAKKLKAEELKQKNKKGSLSIWHYVQFVFFLLVLSYFMQLCHV